MAYVKIIFQNSPSTATPMNAQNLNHMDDQIALNDQRLTEIETSYVKSFNGRTGAVAPADNDYNIGQIAPLSGAQVGQVPVVVNHGTEEEPELVFEMGAGGGGGHSIIDSEGNTMPQESAMQFADSFVSDDDVNGKTVVENIKEHTTKADYDQATEDGFHVIDDGNDVPIGEIEDDVVSVTADGVKTLGQLLNELFTSIDFQNVTENAIFVKTESGYDFPYKLVQKGATTLSFEKTRTAGTNTISEGVIIEETTSRSYIDTITSSGATFRNGKEDIPTSGTIFTLHYGSSSGIVELNTDARHCMMSDGVTSVADELDCSGKKRTYYGIAVTNNIFLVLLPPNIVAKGTPTSIVSNRIVELAVGGKSYSSFSFDDNGLTITTVESNMTVGHAIRFTATITW